MDIALYYWLLGGETLYESARKLTENSLPPVTAIEAELLARLSEKKQLKEKLKNGH